MNLADKMRKRREAFIRSQKEAEVEAAKSLEMEMQTPAVQKMLKATIKTILKHVEEAAAKGKEYFSYDLERNGFDVDFSKELAKQIEKKGFVCAINSFDRRNECDDLITEHCIKVSWYEK